MRRASFAQRGAVLVEFALSSLVLFTVMFGTLELGVVGLEQIKADGAAFTGAHQQALATATSIAATTLVPATYPGVNASDISLVPAPLPSASANAGNNTTQSVPVDYDLSNALARHGGFSLVIPTQIVATVVRPLAANALLGFTGSALNLSGFAAEPQYQEVGIHSDVAGTSVNDIATFDARDSYFTMGENTPPYFVGFNYMKYCTDLTSTCTGAFVVYDALGIAEYLDVDNWSATYNGVQSGAVFADTLMHQQIFAQIAADIANRTGGDPNPATIDQKTLATLGTYLDPNRGDPKIACLYKKWDTQKYADYELGSPDISQIGTATDQYRVNPSAACQ